MTPNRPALTAELTEAEFLRWYWPRAELVTLARHLGVPTGGAKEVLTARIAARLAGRPFEVTRVPRSSTVRMTTPFSPDTVIPPGQPCSQPLRAWSVGELGPSFRFDAAMRGFFAAADGTRTLQDALAHWASTRTDEPKAIDPQFEYNRFTRAWHESHPGGGSSTSLRDAWRAYRAAPTDARTRA